MTQRQPTGTTPPRRVVELVGLVLLALLLAACTGLPTDQVPRPGQPVLGAPLQDVEALPEGPTAGATEQEIVRGFLQANQSFGDGHQIARSFLTQELASSWVPTDDVLVHRGDVQTETPAEGVVEGTVAARAELGQDRRLVELPGESARTGRFGLTRVAGEWRIEEFPEEFGLWLSESEFNAEFRTASISYVSPVQQVFVPDVRWFPREEGLPTALARALLEPVPSELEGAVVTAVPEGTDLIGGAVPVDQGTGTATVNLTGPGPAEDPALARMLWAQVTRTLTQAGGVRRVSLQINGEPIRVAGVDTPAESAQDFGYTDAAPVVEAALLRIGTELTVVDPTDYRLRTLTDARDRFPELPTVATRWSALATNSTLTEFAGVSRDGRTLWRWRGGEEVERADIGTELTAPHFDSTGSLWLAGRSATGQRVWAISTGGPLTSVAARVAVDWLPDQTRIQDLAISPDAQRAVVVLRDELSGVQTIGLAGIVRDREGDPVSLTEPRPLAEVIVSVQGITWASPTSLLLLGQAAQEEFVRPYRMNLDGWLQPLPVETDALTLRALPREDGEAAALVTREGGVYSQEGAGWSPYRNGDDLIVPLG